MLHFSSILARGLRPDASEDFLVGQLSAVKLDLHFLTVDREVALDPEGDGVLDPGLSRPPLGQLALKVLALVVLAVGGQQVLSSEELGSQAQLGAVGGAQADADLQHPTVRRARAVELEEPAQLSEAQLDDEELVSVDEAERVHVGRGASVVARRHVAQGVFPFSSGHGFNPLSFILR